MSATHQQQRRAVLMQALCRAPEDDAAVGARAELERRLSPDDLAALDRRNLAEVVAVEPEGDAEVPVFDAIAAAKVAQRRTLIDAVRGRQPADPPTGMVSMDGGARETAPRVETHETFLTEVWQGRRQPDVPPDYD